MAWLYFLRHGDALEGERDEARALSDQGREQARQIGRFLNRTGAVFDAVYTSPLLRAREMGETVSQHVSPSFPPTPQSHEALLNETSIDDFDAWLKDVGQHSRVLLVGHAPTLAERVCHLLGIPYVEGLKIPKAGLVALERQGSHAYRLQLFVTPTSLGPLT